MGNDSSSTLPYHFPCESIGRSMTSWGLFGRVWGSRVQEHVRPVRQRIVEVPWYFFPGALCGRCCVHSPEETLTHFGCAVVQVVCGRHLFYSLSRFICSQVQPILRQWKPRCCHGHLMFEATPLEGDLQTRRRRRC